MRVLYVAVFTPASQEGERGNTGRQAGRWERPRRDRMVPRCHDGVDGSECTARWVVQGVAGHCLGYVLHNACTCCAVLAPYSTTPQYPDQLLFIIHHCTRAALVCRGQHFSPSGLAGNGNDKDRAREGGARRPVLYLGTQVLYCGTVPVPPRKCLSVLSAHPAVAVSQCTRRAGLLAYEHGKYCAIIHNTHTRTRPKHPPTRSYLRL